jgi:hypothetical protein
MKTKILNEIEGTDLIRVEINHEISVIYKKDLEKIKNRSVRRSK